MVTILLLVTSSIISILVLGTVFAISIRLGASIPVATAITMVVMVAILLMVERFLVIDGDS